LQANEQHIAQWPAQHNRSYTHIEGRLVLTNQRLLFIEQKVYSSASNGFPEGLPGFWLNINELTKIKAQKPQCIIRKHHQLLVQRSNSLVEIFVAKDAAQIKTKLHALQAQATTLTDK
jgi:hypothetical protein